VFGFIRYPLGYFAWMIVAMSVASQSPAPPTLLVAKSAPAWAVATLASIATAIAAIIDYHLVRRVFRVRTLAAVQQHPLFTRAERWAKVAPFLTTFVFAALPLPFAIPRVLMPLSGYPLPRYVTAAALGRFPHVFLLATLGQAIEIPSWISQALVGGGIALLAGSALVRRVRQRAAR
jgi:uncharacterized membrane protein YdjX (TVP38/TMEM64 family)